MHIMSASASVQNKPHAASTIEIVEDTAQGIGNH